MLADIKLGPLFRFLVWGSSAVESAPVTRVVVGSNPTPTAKKGTDVNGIYLGYSGANVHAKIANWDTLLIMAIASVLGLVILRFMK